MISAAFGVSLAILGFGAFLSYRSTAMLVRSEQARQQNHSVLEATQALLAELDDAETGQRGYLITGEPAYLSPYNFALGALKNTMHEIRQLTAGDPEQQLRVKDIEPLVAAKLAELKQTTDLRRTQGYDAARAVVLTNVGKKSMDDLRRIITDMNAAEQSTLNRNQQETEKAGRQTIQAMFLGGGLTVGLLLSIFYLLRQEIGVRTRGEEEIKRLNVGLQQRSTELETANQELESANKELEAFTYSVAHDLRAPLRHIDGFAKMLLEEESAGLSAQAGRYLTRVCEGTRQMGQLVDDLLNLARLGRKPLNLQVTGLNSLAEEVAREIKAENPQREIQLNIQPLPFVECDPALVRQVFSNLLSNAVKYTRPRACAVIDVRQISADGQPAILVRDNGVGFSMKYADKLFGVFQRLHRAEDFEGTGVGLATVQRIVRKHGGRIWAEAELDRGATFYFTLAAAKQDIRNQNSEGALPKAA